VLGDTSQQLAFLVQKGTTPGADFSELVTGAVEALVKLRRQPGKRGWRARVDRGIERT
jgi:hypothetical protein